jgi:hypothetical protein
VDDTHQGVATCSALGEGSAREHVTHVDLRRRPRRRLVGPPRTRRSGYTPGPPVCALWAPRSKLSRPPAAPGFRRARRARHRAHWRRRGVPRMATRRIQRWSSPHHTAPIRAVPAWAPRARRASSCDGLGVADVTPLGQRRARQLQAPNDAWLTGSDSHVSHIRHTQNRAPDDHGDGLVERPHPGPIRQR